MNNNDMRPTVNLGNLSGPDGNVFSIIGNVVIALREAGQKKQAKEFSDKAFASGSYDAVLRLVPEYVQVQHRRR